jgi:hypothetical protein
MASGDPESSKAMRWGPAASLIAVTLPSALLDWSADKTAKHGKQMETRCC